MAVLERLAMADGRLGADVAAGRRGVLVTTGTLPAGGSTRSTWPTSITFGLSRLFHLTRSFQFWPLSRPTRIIVSPGFTV